MRRGDVGGSTGPSHVKLIGAVPGERWCFPGVGKAPRFLVPVQAFPADSTVGRCLVKLTRHQGGWKPQSDEATGEPVLSSAPVTAFLAKIADDDGEVRVLFGHISPPAWFDTEECCSLDEVSTPRSDGSRVDEA